MSANIYEVFVGVVEDRQDPFRIGRVRVRVFGIHTSNKSQIPTASLPWADVPLNLSLRIKEGDHVKLYFKDGSERQMPVITEIIVGIPETGVNSKDGFNDPRTEDQRKNAPRAPATITQNNDGTGITITEQPQAPANPSRLHEPTNSRLVRGENLDEYTNLRNTERTTGIQAGISEAISGLATSFGTSLLNGVLDQLSSIVSSVPMLNAILPGVLQRALQNSKFTPPDSTYTQPPSAHNPQYPYNHATVTESGHVIEHDDTPGAERIHTRHRTGTFDEMAPDGSRVQQTANSSHKIVGGSDFVIVKGKQQVVVEGTQSVIIKGAQYVQVEGVSKIICLGNAQVNVVGDMTHKVAGNYNLYVGGNFNLKVYGSATYHARQAYFKADAIMEFEGRPVNINGSVIGITEPGTSAFGDAEFFTTPTYVTEAANQIADQINTGIPLSDIELNTSPRAITANTIGPDGLFFGG